MNKNEDEREPDTASPGLDLPDLPLPAWEDAKRTLHLYLQIVGKIRMALHPKLNHWDHVTLYLSPRGLTTGAVPAGAGLVDIEFDFVDHNVVIRGSTGARKVISLYDGLSVASFYTSVLGSLRQLGVEVRILAKPYDPAKVGSDLPFRNDHTHTRYDPPFVNRFWQILVWVDAVFREFRGRFYGKSTPVHLFWHSLDLVHTRFSGRAAPLEGGSSSDREAYSHEVVSFGFWAGDDQVPAPAFYSYTYPEPGGLKEAPLLPEAAFWKGEGNSMALLMYDDLRELADPKGALLDFLESA